MKLTHFKVMKYRNVMNSGWIDVNDITAFVGQNEAGKSNFFEALYRVNPFTPSEAYSLDEDWPVDDWGNKDASTVVCEAKFALDEAEIEDLYEQAWPSKPKPAEGSQEGQNGTDQSVTSKVESTGAKPPSELILIGSRSYDAEPIFATEGKHADELDATKVNVWAKKHAPKFVLIQDYGLSGTQIELNELAAPYARAS